MINGVENRRTNVNSTDTVSSPESEVSSPRGSAPVDAPTEHPPYLLEERIESPSAGLFYLVNVALSLGLYGDFTSPQNPGLELPLWDFLELVGARLLVPAIADDPLFPLFARLSQRPSDEPAGKHFTPPDGLEITAWLDRTERQIRDRLEGALGVCGEVMTTLVLRQRGTVCVTATRADITFFLAEHPIELRLSGLDRDPGWVPAGGRSIAYHYE